MPKAPVLRVFASRRMAVLALFGFSSGLPLMLTGQTLQAWVTAAKVDLSQIAAFSLVGLAYTLKPTWAPLLDRYSLPFLGRRRGWVLVTQLGLVVAIAAMAFADPVGDPVTFAIVAVVVAVLSASQDVVLDAYNTDVLAPHERAAGAGIYVFGYRVATLASGTLALIMADHVTWQAIYLTMAGLMVIGIAGTLLAEEPDGGDRKPRSLAAAFYLPLTEFYARHGLRTVAILLFAALYRFGDYFAQSLIITFLKSDSGFEFTEIATVHKALGVASMAVGGLAAGVLVARYGLRRLLVGFGLLAAMTNILYTWLALAGKSMPIFCTAVVVDSLATAMGTAAFLAFFMQVCSPAVSATQFALLTSLSSVGQRVFGHLADDVVAVVGWDGFFAVTALMAIPGLVLAWFLAKPGVEGEEVARSPQPP